MYIVWALPILAVVVLVGSGKVSSVSAGVCGAIAAGTVALTAAPVDFGATDAVYAAACGAWLALLISAVVLGGLFFRETVFAGMQERDAAVVQPDLRRKRLFTTCFLVGPFAESATGFGVGQVTAIPALRGIGLRRTDIVLFGLFSQTMVPWGALAIGTIAGAQLSGVSAQELGIRSAVLTSALLLAWLMLFWRMAHQAGVSATILSHLSEVFWMLGIAALLTGANAAVGPEVAALVGLGPLVALRFVLHERRDRGRWRTAIRIGLPFAVLIGALASTRVVPALGDSLAAVITFRPFADGPTLFPLLHPAFWLILIGSASAILLGRFRNIRAAALHAWTTGRRPCGTILGFLVMAQIMANSGTAAGLAGGLRLLLGPAAPLSTPILAGLFGFLTSSGNASNSLLMASQVALASKMQVSVGWIAAVQNTAAASLTMLSPVRLSMGCALVGRPDLERAVYARAWPLGLAPLAVLMSAVGILAFGH